MLTHIVSKLALCVVLEGPAEPTHHRGFDDDQEQQLVRMLAFEDVHEPRGR